MQTRDLKLYLLWKLDKPRRARCASCGESFHPDRLLEVGEGEATETLDPGEKVCRICAPRHAIPVPRQKGCERCEGGWRRLVEQIVDTTTGELVEATNTVRCRYCRKRPPEPTLTDEEMLEWMATAPWREAKTYRGSGHEHEYTLRRQQDPDYFDRAARTVWWMGFDRHYLRRPWRTIDLDGYILWVYTKPQGPRDPYPEDTLLVNRAPSSIRKAGL